MSKEMAPTAMTPAAAKPATTPSSSAAGEAAQWGLVS
jgi:hypothetical protein